MRSTVVTLRGDIYYFCCRGKPSANLKKIREYCSPHGCPFLKSRKKKNAKNKPKSKRCYR